MKGYFPALLVVALILFLIQAVSMGVAEIPPFAVLSLILGRVPLIGSIFAASYPASWATIILRIRLPRALLGAIVGASLAASGASMQAFFRNPMADPFIVGISSGAALGAASTLVLESLGLLPQGYYLSPVAAFLGGLGAVLLVHRIASVGGRAPVESLLLAGVAVTSFLSAATSLVIYIHARDLVTLLFWLTGSLGASKWTDVEATLPISLAGLVVLTLFAREMNIMLLGEETARNLGVDIETVKKVLLVASSLITASCVASAGIIGFVGLVTPHMVRLIVGPDHRVLLPSSTLLGAIFLVGCDTIARVFAEVPVGVVTSLLGAPFFIYLLWKRKRSL